MVELPDFDALEAFVAGRDADVFIAYGANTPAKDEPCAVPHIAVSDMSRGQPPGHVQTREWPGPSLSS